MFWKFEKKRVLTMGTGESLISHGSHQGLPMICIVEAPNGCNKDPRESADEHVEHMKNNGVVIQFATIDAAVHLLERLQDAIDEHMEPTP